MNCLFLNLFEQSLSAFPRRNKGFYLQENQAWERALIYAWRKVGHGELVGVPHTVISSWDLRHFFSPEAYQETGALKLPLPDHVALNGEAAIKAYQKGGYPRELMVEVEALRYLYLGKIVREKSVSKSDDRIRLLVLGDCDESITNRQIDLLVEGHDRMPENVRILVKSHPLNPVNLRQWPSIEMEAVDKPLDQLVDAYDIAYTSNATAAAVDAYLAHKKVIVMLDPDDFNFSPLRGYSGVSFAATSGELVDGVVEADIVADVSEGEAFFYTDPELPRWKYFLNGSHPESV